MWNRWLVSPRFLLQALGPSPPLPSHKAGTGTGAVKTSLGTSCVIISVPLSWAVVANVNITITHKKYDFQ